MSRLVLEAVTKTFGDGPTAVEVLRGVDLALDADDSVAVTGPSGSGKSTLLHIVGTLEAPTSGRVVLDGEDPFTRRDTELARYRNRTVGFVFQDHHLLPQYTVLENVLLPTLAFPPADEEAEDRARELLERVGLGHRLGHRPAEISGGERQRAAVARALVQQPTLLLCDEPTGNLDHANAMSVADLLLELQREMEALLVVVTHSDELAARFARRVRLAEGRCVAA